MKSASPLLRHLSLNHISRPLFAFSVALAIVITAGCGGGSSQPPPPVLSGNTAVTVLPSSTANDQLSQFDIGFNSITLTSQSGKTVNLFVTSLSPEFIHLNGKVEPLLTVTVPQDIYTSATASIGPTSFTCEAIDPSDNSLYVSTYAYGEVPAAQVTVNVPAPITVTGDAMGLSLNMLVSQSASFPSTCYDEGIAQYSITPTFDLTPVAFSPAVAEPLLDGEIASVNAVDNSFTIMLAGGEMSPGNGFNGNGQTLSVNTNESTVYQGINGFSALTVGTFVDMDAAIQADGSQLATRIAVEDTDTTNLSVSTGPLLQVAGSEPSLFAFGRQDQGYLRTSGQAGDFMAYSFGSAVFQISGRLTNLQSLPFVPSFDAANMFDGQNVYATTHATTLQGGPTYFPATTITLIPQTINGTINGISSDRGFTIYDVTLAAYDLIPDLAVQPGQTTVLTNPSNVVVYVDSSTQMLNSQPLAVGSVARFNGMLFNDNGTARMDCGQVNDGVAVQPETQAAVAGRSSHLAQPKIVVHRYLQNPGVSK
jgi:hypothetical protein